MREGDTRPSPQLAVAETFWVPVSPESLLCRGLIEVEAEIRWPAAAFLSSRATGIGPDKDTWTGGFKDGVSELVPGNGASSRASSSLLTSSLSSQTFDSSSLSNA